MSRHRGKVMTVRGPVAPERLGRVSMHEHLHCDCYDWERQSTVNEEKPISPERRDLLRREALPFLRRYHEFGSHGYLDATPAPWRAWASFMLEAAEATDLHIVACTGFYCELNPGEAWAKRPEDAIWPFVRNASVEELADFCTRDIVEGMHGTRIRAGAIKLGGRNPELSAAEAKAFRAGARAQKSTGVHITTHCTRYGGESSQLRLLDAEGVDLGRCVIGHTHEHLIDPEVRKVCLDWMRRGANFLPTNLGIDRKRSPSEPPPSVTRGGGAEEWRPLVEAIHRVFDAGLGEHICFGLDFSFVSESAAFGPCDFIPPPPYIHMFTHTLPAMRSVGLGPAEEDAIMRANPQRIIAIQ